MDLASLWQQWPLSGRWQVSDLDQGANNRVQRVDTPASGSYVLRLDRNHDNPTRLRFELTLITHLQAMGLPFTVPAPLPTRSGDLWYRLPAEDGAALVTLTPLILGEHPARHNLEQAYAAAVAVGILDTALARLALPTSPDLSPPPSMGTLCHQLLAEADPLAAIAALPLDAETRSRIYRLLDQVDEQASDLYAALPQQLVHRDFDPSNVLMEGACVTGIIDFEFSTRDLRVIELVIPLSWWLVTLPGSGDQWAVIDALGRGYTSQQPLLPAEVDALPLLLQLRATAGLLHHVGRYRQGLTTSEPLVDRVVNTLQREDWLSANSARLLARARSW